MTFFERASFSVSRLVIWWARSSRSVSRLLSFGLMSSLWAASFATFWARISRSISSSVNCWASSLRAASALLKFLSEVFAFGFRAVQALRKCISLGFEFDPLGLPGGTRVFELVGEPGDFGVERVGFDRALRIEGGLLAQRGGDGVELLVDFGFEPGGLLAAGGESRLRALLQIAQGGSRERRGALLGSQ